VNPEAVIDAAVDPDVSVDKARRDIGADRLDERAARREARARTDVALGLAVERQARDVETVESSEVVDQPGPDVRGVRALARRESHSELREEAQQDGQALLFGVRDASRSAEEFVRPAAEGIFSAPLRVPERATRIVFGEEATEAVTPDVADDLERGGRGIGRGVASLVGLPADAVDVGVLAAGGARFRLKQSKRKDRSEVVRRLSRLAWVSVRRSASRCWHRERLAVSPLRPIRP